MIIDDKLLAKLENLSAIKIDESAKDEIKAQLSEILNFVENLNSLNLPPITHAQKYTALREDIEVKGDVSDFVLEHAPSAKDRFFIVPKIVE